MQGMMGRMMGGMWIWAIGGVLVIVFLAIAFLKLFRR
jgi:hypothetical protein